jgi:hypothetical protein
MSSRPVVATKSSFAFGWAGCASAAKEARGRASMPKARRNEKKRVIGVLL